MRSIRAALAFLALLVCGLARAPLASAQPVQEHALKAAYVYNFVQLVEWPEGALGAPDAPFALCVLGGSAPLRGMEALNTKRAHSRRIQVRAVAGEDDARDCHVLFVSGPQAARASAIVAALAQAPVLSVVDAEEPKPGAAAITLVPREARIGFHVNLGTAKHAQLRISSRLLRLALSVTGGSAR